METVQRDAPPAAAPLEALARIGAAVAHGESLGPVLTELAEAVADVVGATLVVIRALDSQERLCARGVAAASRALAAELERSRLPSGYAPDGELEEDKLPPTLRDTASRIGAGAVLVVPVPAGSRVVGALEVYRGRTQYDDSERALIRVAAAQAGVAMRDLGGPVEGTGAH